MQSGSQLLRKMSKLKGYFTAASPKVETTENPPVAVAEPAGEARTSAGTPASTGSRVGLR